jgi:hypothetical protein
MSKQNTPEELQAIVSQEKLVRQQLTDKWLSLWTLYKTRPIKVAADDGWQSKLNDGRVFEIVETVGAYLRNALFFSDNWFAIESNEPGLGEVLPLVNSFVVNSLNRSNFRREFTVFITQLLLTGFSAIIPFWDETTDNISFRAINSYDLHIETSQRYDAGSSYSFREVELNEATYVSWCEAGLLDASPDDWSAYASSQQERDSDNFINRDTIPVANKESVLVCEYYCPLSKTLTRLIEDEVVWQEEVDYCPWLVGLLFETPDDSYALSLIDSSLGLILANNILHNRRLDNMALSVDNMWMFVDDGVTNPEDIKSEPGKVLVVGSPDSLVPMRPPANNFNITYQEEQVLDQRIDRNIGTISTKSFRTGERVTAEEIKSIKDAGGNRLTDVYEHIEQTIVIPLLYRCLNIFKDNLSKSKIVKLASSKPNVYEYFKLLPEDLTHDFSLKITGTQSVINRDRNISLLTEFLTLVANVPQFQELVDYTNLYTDLLVKFGFDDPQRYLIKPKEGAGEAPQPQTPIQSMAGEAAAIGGSPMAGAVQDIAARGDALELVSSMGGQLPGATSELSPDQAMIAQAQLQTPQL